MTRFRFAALMLGLAAIVAVSGVQAQDKKDNKRPGGGGFGGGRINAVSGPLVPDNVQDKLSLTAEQKEKVAKLQKEYDEKSKDTTDKIRQEIQDAIQNQNFQALGGLNQKMQEVQKVRTDYEGKVKDLLTDDQKKTFETALKDRPTGGFGGFGGGGGIGGFGGGAGGFGGGARVQTPKELTSTDVQDKLNLTKEQKDKIAKLKKEFEEQTQSVLTDEQKKKFEEIKKEQPDAPRRPAGGAGRGGDGGRGGNRNPAPDGK